MRRKQLWMGVAILFLVLSVAFFAGCTKKGPLKNETWIEKPTVQGSAKAATDDKESRERTLREQEIREQTLKDQAKGKSLESTRRLAEEREAVIQKELQIPDIYFDFDEYKLKPANQAILKEASRAYLKYTEYKLVIEGHCDERGNAEYNLALGQKRADEAANFLIDLGIAKERIKTISYGKERPRSRA